MMQKKTSASFKLSAFGDEIAADLREQLQVLRQLRIGYLELRDVWSKNVLHLDDDEVAKAGRICAKHEVTVSCIGSPVGKSPITQPIEHEISNLCRIFQIAAALGTRRVRIFSFYPPDTHTNVHYDQHVAAATSRLARLTEMARRAGFFLLLENEKEIVGDTIERCHTLVSAIDSPHLRFLWDPANFVQVDEATPTLRGWHSLGPYVAHVHVKDALLADGSVQAAGEGDGQVGELLARLRDDGYQGFLALEPHLAVAGRSGGFSGIEGMTRAVKALRRLMAAQGCIEEQTE
jgi:sugar phosphate isomerase/epimerase